MPTMRLIANNFLRCHNGSAPIELEGGGRFVLTRKGFVPAYVKAFQEGVLQDRAEQAIESLRSCRVCPRDCEIDRFNNKIGVCKSGRLARLASAFPHFGEEDCLRGWNGSGTIFFSFCNLRCVFCQNWDISQRGEGREVLGADLAEMMLDLQERGCHNVNFVTPEHVVPQLLEGLLLARHLVMPGGLEDAREILRFLAAEVSPDAYVNVMAQYYPAGGVEEAKHPELCRRPDEREILAAREIAETEGLWRFDERWRGA